MVCGWLGAFRLPCRLSVAVPELVGGSGIVVSLIVHRFYLTKKKVYLSVGKLQRSREKNKTISAAVAALVQVWPPCFCCITWYYSVI